MVTADLEELKAEFVKVFAAVPLPLRGEIVAVVDNEPVTWSAAYLEIEQNTQKAKRILNILKEIEVL